MQSDFHHGLLALIHRKTCRCGAKMRRAWCDVPVRRTGAGATTAFAYRHLQWRDESCVLATGQTWPRA
jgi:hypothetical protein